LTNAEQHYRKMTMTPVPTLILRLGIPTTISMLITNIYNMADTYFVGTLGPSAQAATGVLFTLQAIIQGIAFMMGHGSGTFISKELAGKDTDRASMYVSSAFFAGGFVGVLILSLGMVFLSPLVRFLGSTETIAPYAMDYGFWVLLSAPFVICSMILNNALRYEGCAFYAMFGLTTGGILNIFGDYMPGLTESDFYELEIASGGVMGSYMAIECDMYFPIERKLRLFLQSCFRIYKVPEEKQEAVIRRVLAIDIESMAKNIVAQTVKLSETGFDAELLTAKKIE